MHKLLIKDEGKSAFPPGTYLVRIDATCVLLILLHFFEMVAINPILAHQPFTMPDGVQNPSLLSWNIRELPSTFLRLTSAPARTLNPHELATPATQPLLTRLRIFCGIFPGSDLDVQSSWRIEVQNLHGVTVKDVLTAIYEAFQRPYSHEEFNALCAKTQSRVLEAYHARVHATANPRTAWEAGIRRSDCLMRHSWFGGLSMSLPVGDGTQRMQDTCCLILSLRIGEEATLVSPTRIMPSPFR
ncbi:hypothetical protein BT96DRAFT_679834 [Gymnopus androsaceus JB14]|uniref:DUF6699 domain-containing protein n=1 Tax=Gymnopus androsaceus JB14 TaxID=1447944 RepID=A0A6A4HP74_9AGAR|nr:hypothetical protein BT96DRAFT_679834 [Gymnopus androsaceus JB14]